MVIIQTANWSTYKQLCDVKLKYCEFKWIIKSDVNLHISCSYYKRFLNKMKMSKWEMIISKYIPPPELLLLDPNKDPPPPPNTLLLVLLLPKVLLFLKTKKKEKNNY